MPSSDARSRYRSRLRSFSRRRSEEQADRAAVVLAVMPDREGELCICLTRRAGGLATNSGQFALPGGRIERHETAVAAARREFREELGLDLGTDALLGLLDDYESRSGFSITPSVWWIDEHVALTPRPGEVAGVYLVPLQELAAPGAVEFEPVVASGRTTVSVRALGMQIYAPTGAILFQFREVVLLDRSRRVHDFDDPAFAWR